MSVEKELSSLVAAAFSEHPFYRELYSGVANEFGVKPEVEFRELPILRPQDIVAHREMFSISPATYRYTASSGTTGRPKIFAKTLSDTSTSTHAMAELLRQCEVNSEDVMCIAQPFELSHIGYITMGACVVLGAKAVPVGLSLNEPALDAMIKATKSTVLFTSPSKLRALYRSKSDVPEHIRVVILAGEKVDPHELHGFGESLGVKAFSLYGSEDTDGLGYSCAVCEGYHLLDEFFYFEFVDPETGLRVDGGGSVIITSMYARGMPLIRYELGDYHLPIVNKCGRSGQTVNILGRVDDSIQLFDGVTLFAYQLSAIGQELSGNGNYQFEYRENPDCSCVVLKLEGECEIPINEAIQLMQNCCPDIRAISEQKRVSFQIIENSKINYTSRGKRPLVIKPENDSE